MRDQNFIFYKTTSAKQAQQFNRTETYRNLELISLTITAYNDNEQQITQHSIIQ